MSQEQLKVESFIQAAEREVLWVKEGKSLPLFSAAHSGPYKILLELYEKKELAPDETFEKRIADKIAKIEKILSDFIVKNVSKFVIDGVIPLDNKLLSYNLAEVSAIRKYLDKKGQAESVAVLDKLIEFLKTGNPDELKAIVGELTLASSVAKYARESILRYIGGQQMLGNKKTAEKLHAILTGENLGLDAQKSASAVSAKYSMDEIEALEKECAGEQYASLRELLAALRQLKEQRDDSLSLEMADFWLALSGRGFGEALIKAEKFTAALHSAEAFMQTAVRWMSEEDFAWADSVFQYAEGAYQSFTGDIESQQQLLFHFGLSSENQESKALFRAFIAFQHKVMTKNIVEAFSELPELYKAFIDADKMPKNKERSDFLRGYLKQVLLNSPVPENDYALIKHSSDEVVRFEKMYALCGDEQPFSKIAELLHALHELMLRKQPDALIKAVNEARVLLGKIKTEQPAQGVLLETMIHYTEMVTTRFVAGLDDLKNKRDQKLSQDIMHYVVYEGVSSQKRPSLETFEQYAQTLKSQVANARQVQTKLVKDAARPVGSRPLPPPPTPAAGKPSSQEKMKAPTIPKRPHA